MKLLAFGEVVWDEIDGQRCIGGAPFNVAAHARRIGIEGAYLFTAVGDDALGTATLNTMESQGVGTDFVKTIETPTCVVRALIDENKNARFLIPERTTFDLIRADDASLQLIRDLGFDCLYFGTIAQRSPTTRESLRKVIATGKFRHIFFDVNLRMSFIDKEVLEYSLAKASIVKVNEKELQVMKELFGLKEEGYGLLAERFRRDFGIRWMCITCGPKGAYVSTEDAFRFCPAYAVNVVDTVGAGDAFSAAMISSLESGTSPEAACDFACKVGALVASRRGALPDYTRSELGLAEMSRAGSSLAPPT